MQNAEALETTAVPDIDGQQLSSDERGWNEIHRQ